MTTATPTTTGGDNKTPQYRTVCVCDRPRSNPESVMHTTISLFDSNDATHATVGSLLCICVFARRKCADLNSNHFRSYVICSLFVRITHSMQLSERHPDATDTHTRTSHAHTIGKTQEHRTYEIGVLCASRRIARS